MLPVNTLHPVRKPAYATYGLILLNALVFLWQLTNTGEQLNAVFWNYAAVMCKVAANPISVDTTADIIRSMFFHGGWAHLVGNMTFLWIFGRNAENYFGSGRFVLFYLLWGFIAAFAETIINSGVCVPMIGASGAVAGVLGSYLLLYPGSRVRVLIVFFRFFPKFYDIPALIVLGYWFVLQLFNGFLTLGANTLGGGVAFFAHIGGFVGGLLVAFVYMMFKGPPERVTYVD
ncbi:MAG: rhomboid family intramembrane serine protease [Chloroflexi bacterium]|nr:rhomboid family intramembrane serine protease [Chloroflexota bacterium]MCC6893629.1 rhomboid family intramembrane serine protease [Anaerolineae bacterium]